MTDNKSRTPDQAGGVLLGERVIPVPASISEQARTTLRNLAARPMIDNDYPPADDMDAWREYISAHDREMFEQLAAGWSHLPDLMTSTEPDSVAGVTVYRSLPRDRPAETANLLCLYFHGGALVYLGGEGAHFQGMDFAASSGLATLSVDYGMPPDKPFPVGLDESLAVYRKMLEQYDAAQIIFAGSSAGGNIAAALALRAPDEGLPLPGGMVLMTPELDLTESGDSFQTNRNIDGVLIEGMPGLNRLYAAGHPLDDPYVSPLFGDFSKGFPPTFLKTGTRDLFLSNTVRMHRALRRAEIDAELHVWEAMPHGGFFGAPEDLEVAQELRRFLKRL